MTAVFADTFYFIALLNADDEAHHLAQEFAGDQLLTLVTTSWVLTELAEWPGGNRRPKRISATA